jgi:hypothetical protein
MEGADTLDKTKVLTKTRSLGFSDARLVDGWISVRGNGGVQRGWNHWRFGRPQLYVWAQALHYSVGISLGTVLPHPFVPLSGTMRKRTHSISRNRRCSSWIPWIELDKYESKWMLWLIMKLSEKDRVLVLLSREPLLAFTWLFRENGRSLSSVEEGRLLSFLWMDAEWMIEFEIRREYGHIGFDSFFWGELFGRRYNQAGIKLPWNTE